MELTIDQVLHQGAAAGKEGKLQEAKRLYRVILWAHPTHPDTNNNQSYLAVAINKREAALPLFKTTLELNPKAGAFCLNYIDALIKEKRLEPAEAVLKQEKKAGLAEEKLNNLEMQLDTVTKKEVANSSCSLQQYFSNFLERFAR